METSATNPTPTGDQPLLEVSDLKVHFRLTREARWPWSAVPVLKAVDGVSLQIRPGQTLGVVGESGCGKSTLARALVDLVPVTGGSIRWQGREMVGADKASWMGLRRHVQMIFQDPLASLDPRMTVGQCIAEPLVTHEPELSADAVRARVLATMQRVGLTEQQINRYPHEFSGGQCQRIGIARALILGPRLIVCDEPVSALDVSIQAQIINLLQELQAEMGLALVFIAHDLAVVRHVSHEVLVMYLGRAVERAPKRALYANPQHPYTQALLRAIPQPDPLRERSKSGHLLQGELPSPIHPPSGCAFRTRCPIAQPACAEQRPVLKPSPSGGQVACIRVAP